MDWDDRPHAATDTYIRQQGSLNINVGFWRAATGHVRDTQQSAGVRFRPTPLHPASGCMGDSFVSISETGSISVAPVFGNGPNFMVRTFSDSLSRPSCFPISSQGSHAARHVAGRVVKARRLDRR